MDEALEELIETLIEDLLGSIQSNGSLPPTTADLVRENLQTAYALGMQRAYDRSTLPPPLASSRPSILVTQQPPGDLMAYWQDSDIDTLMGGIGEWESGELLDDVSYIVDIDLNEED